MCILEPLASDLMVSDICFEISLSKGYYTGSKSQRQC